MSRGRFAGKVVVVTGAAQGIGRAVSERLFEECAEVVLVDRSGFRAPSQSPGPGRHPRQSTYRSL